jgi:hypothetical protein
MRCNIIQQLGSEHTTIIQRYQIKKQAYANSKTPNPIAITTIKTTAEIQNTKHLCANQAKQCIQKASIQTPSRHY